MAILNNPMSALVHINQLASAGGGTAVRGIMVVSKDIGDPCYPNGDRFASMPYTATVITPDGQTCTLHTFCAGQCVNGRIEATSCDEGTLSDCKNNNDDDTISDLLSPL